jgi:hypothetical protein
MDPERRSEATEQTLIRMGDGSGREAQDPSSSRLGHLHLGDDACDKKG